MQGEDIPHPVVLHGAAENAPGRLHRIEHRHCQRGLARSGFSNDRGNLTGNNVEINIPDSREVVPAQKIVVGIANYAYDWGETEKKGTWSGAEFSVQEALLHAFESETDVEVDETSLNPHYSYSDEQNHIHRVWILDAVTAYNQLRACERLGVQPDETIFLDDAEPCVTGALELGIHGILYKDTDQAIADIDALLQANAT